VKPLRLSLAFLSAVFAVQAFAGGTISGSVAFTGSAPTPAKLNRKADAFCAKTEAVDEAILASKDGKSLQNVLVRLKEAPAGAVPSTPVTVDQTSCLYRPRVQGAVEGQKIEVRNSDPTLHNVHAYQGPKTMFNTAQPPKGTPMVKPIPAGTDVMKLKCDVHTWMTAYVVVSKHPYFATTGADGKFEIKGVPPGKYTVEAWHEKLGTVTSDVTVEDGKSVDPKLSFAIK